MGATVTKVGRLWLIRRAAVHGDAVVGEGEGDGWPPPGRRAGGVGMTPSSGASLPQCRQVVVEARHRWVDAVGDPAGERQAARTGSPPP